MTPLYALHPRYFTLVRFQLEGLSFFSLFNGLCFLQLKQSQAWDSVENFARDFSAHYAASPASEVAQCRDQFVSLLKAEFAV